MNGVEHINLLAAWSSIFLGLVTGIGQGLFFHKDDWLGGYGSWRRRLLRLAHISFFGLAFLNLAFVQVSQYAPWSGLALQLPSTLFLVGLVSMPAVCICSAFWKNMRYLFAVPVISLVSGAGVILYMGI